MQNSIDSIAVVGSGLIGASWAAFLASRGLAVRLYDSDESRRRAGLIKAQQQMAFLSAQGLGPSSDEPDGPIELHDTLEACVSDVSLVIEAVSESYEVKTVVFTALDELTRSDCILASSSSSLLMTRIQDGLNHPERTLIAHPFNPVHLVPLVELVGGEKTDPTILEFMKQFLATLGKTPVVLRKETPGFIGNRLQAAVWREAINLVRRGVASVEDVDQALAAGPGLRWALMGQHLIFHLGGGEGGVGYFLDHVGVNFQALWRDMDDWDQIPPETWPLLTEGVADEMQGASLGQWEAWRDQMLSAIVQLKEEHRVGEETL